MSRSVAIIGGGLAGTACARILKRHGSDVTIFEATCELAAGASGNVQGIYNPRFAALRTPESEFYMAGFEAALEAFRALEHTGQDIEWNQCGSLYLVRDEKKHIQFGKMLKNWGWDEARMRMLGAREASDIAGLEIPYEALYLPEGGTVSPRKLCRAYAQDIEVRLNNPVEDLEALEREYDVVILACGIGVKRFAETNFLPLKRIGGQVSRVKSGGALANLRTNLCYSGYCSPALNGVHTVGATFRLDDYSETIRDEDDRENISKLCEALPDLECVNFEVMERRFSVRVSPRDYFPIVGRVPDHKNLYLSVGYGSHGLVGSITAAHILSHMILESSQSVSPAVLKKLNPARFF